MFKMCFAFLVVFCLVVFGAISFKKLKNVQKWELTKIIFWGILASVTTVGILSLIVFIF